MAPIKSLEHFRVKPRWLFVKITDQEGADGWGESTLEGHTRAVEGALDDVSEWITGQEANDIEYVWQKTHRRGFYRGGPVFMSALSGVDIALWDLKAKKLGQPVWQLLGGKVRNKIQIYAWIGGDKPSDIESAARARLSQGYKHCKMNATGSMNWLDDPSSLTPTLDRLKTVRRVGLVVGLDFHGRLHLPMAKQLAHMLELPAEERPFFIEEPLLSEHPEAIARLNQQTTIPIALGERLYTRWDVKPYLQAGAVDILQPDLSHAGGISEVKRIANMAEAFDVGIAPHCPLGPIALAASMAVAASTQNFVIQEMSRGIHYNAEAGNEELETYLADDSKSAFTVKEGGYIDVLEAPGLGIQIDEAMVRRISADAEPWPLQGFYGPDGEIREW